MSAHCDACGTDLVYAGEYPGMECPVCTLQKERDDLAAEGERLQALHLERTKRTHADLTELIARAVAAEAEVERMRDALLDLISKCAPPVEALCAVHADGKWIAPSTVEALMEASNTLHAALAYVESLA